MATVHTHLAPALAVLAWWTAPGSNATVVLLTLGVVLICLELNRPGWIVPGATGLLLFLLAAAAVVRSAHAPLTIALLLLGIALSFPAIVYKLSSVFSVFPATAFAVGFLHLRATAALALPCAILLGAGSFWLGRIAHRARANKGLDLKRARTSRPGVSKF